MVILYFIIIMLMRVMQSVFSKRSANNLTAGGRPFVFYISMSKGFSALFGIVLILIIADFSPISVEGVGIASLSGLFLALNSYCSIKSLQSGTIVLNSIFATTGMIIPIIAGTFLFDESVSWLQVVFIALLFVGIYLIIGAAKKDVKSFSPKTLIYLLGSFFTNGCVMLCQKQFGISFPEENVALFSLVTFLVPAIIMGIAVLFIPKKPEETVKNSIPPRLVGYAAILAFAVFVIQQLVTELTPKVSSAILFTVVNGGASVIAAIVGVVMYKEKLTKRSLLGIILSLAALICIKIFEG